MATALGQRPERWPVGIGQFLEQFGTLGPWVTTLILIALGAGLLVMVTWILAGVMRRLLGVPVGWPSTIVISLLVVLLTAGLFNTVIGQFHTTEGGSLSGISPGAGMILLTIALLWTVGAAALMMFELITPTGSWPGLITWLADTGGPAGPQPPVPPGAGDIRPPWPDLRDAANGVMPEARPLLRKLPRRISHLTEDLHDGRLSVNVRVLAHAEDRNFITRLIQQFTAAVLAGFCVLGGLVLIAFGEGGPALTDHLSWQSALGYIVLFTGFLLPLRTVTLVLYHGDRDSPAG